MNGDGKVTGAYDAQRWTAEELAIELGLLRECPYHGEPFRVVGTAAARSPASRSGTASAGSSLLSAARAVASQYGHACRACTTEHTLH
jgi:hypothetical protein